MQKLRGFAQAEARGLLRLLFLRLGAMPAHPGGKSGMLGGVLPPSMRSDL